MNWRNILYVTLTLAIVAAFVFWVTVGNHIRARRRDFVNGHQRAAIPTSSKIIEADSRKSRR
jgi:hypothetical protein